MPGRTLSPRSARGLALTNFQLSSGLNINSRFLIQIKKDKQLTILDPRLVNAWGLARTPTSFWRQGCHWATLYDRSGAKR